VSTRSTRVGSVASPWTARSRSCNTAGEFPRLGLRPGSDYALRPRMLLTMVRQVLSHLRSFSAQSLTISDAGCLSHASAQVRHASAQAEHAYCIRSLPRAISVAERM